MKLQNLLRYKIITIYIKISLIQLLFINPVRIVIPYEIFSISSPILLNFSSIFWLTCFDCSSYLFFMVWISFFNSSMYSAITIILPDQSSLAPLFFYLKIYKCPYSSQYWPNLDLKVAYSRRRIALNLNSSSFLVIYTFSKESLMTDMTILSMIIFNRMVLMKYTMYPLQVWNL